MGLSDIMTSDEMIARAKSKLQRSFIDLASIADDPGYFNPDGSEAVEAMGAVKTAFAFVMQVKGVIYDSIQ